MENQLSALQRRLASFPAKRVLFVVWHQPLISVGRHTFIADALRYAGAVSIVDAEQDWPQVSLEEAAPCNPTSSYSRPRIPKRLLPLSKLLRLFPGGASWRPLVTAA